MHHTCSSPGGSDASSRANGSTSVGAVARRQLEAGLVELGRRLARAAKHDGDHAEVHGLRVATRRLCEMLRIYEPLLPSDDLRWLRDRLKRIRRAADAARDFDVMDERLATRSDRSSVVARDLGRAERRRAQRPIERIWQRQRRKLRRRGRRLLEGIHDGGRPYPRWLARTVRRHVNDLSSAAGASPDDVAALHRLRIAAKKLRYALELTAADRAHDFDGEIVAELRALQALLGEVTDRATAIARMRGWRAAAKADAPDLAPAIAREEEGLARATRSFASSWRPARQRALDGALERLLEGLGDDDG